MSEMTLDDGMLAVLENLKGLTVLRGKSGKVVGRFYPGEMADEEVYANADSLLDPAECQRRKAAELGKGSPLGEVLARIQAGGKP